MSIEKTEITEAGNSQFKIFNFFCSYNNNNYFDNSNNNNNNNNNSDNDKNNNSNTFVQIEDNAFL